MHLVILIIPLIAFFLAFHRGLLPWRAGSPGLARILLMVWGTLALLLLVGGIAVLTVVPSGIAAALAALLVLLIGKYPAACALAACWGASLFCFPFIFSRQVCISLVY